MFPVDSPDLADVMYEAVLNIFEAVRFLADVATLTHLNGPTPEQSDRGPVARRTTRAETLGLGMHAVRQRHVEVGLHLHAIYRRVPPDRNPIRLTAVLI